MILYILKGEMPFKMHKIIYIFSRKNIKKRYVCLPYIKFSDPLPEIKVDVSSNRRVAEIQIFEKTYLIVIKDETGLKFKMNDSTLFPIGSYAQKLVASYLKMGR